MKLSPSWEAAIQEHIKLIGDNATCSCYSVLRCLFNLVTSIILIFRSINSLFGKLWYLKLSLLSVISRECMTTRNIRKMLPIILGVSSSLKREIRLLSLTEFQYLVMTISKVNRPAQVNEMSVLCFLQNWVMSVIKSHVSCNIC
jgi:hypothetical protein